MAKIYMGYIRVNVSFVSAMLRANIQVSNTEEKIGEAYAARPGFSQYVFNPNTATASSTVDDSNLLPNGYHYIVHGLRGGDWGRNSSSLLDNVKSIAWRERRMSTHQYGNEALSLVSQRAREFAAIQQVWMLPQIKLPKAKPEVSSKQSVLTKAEMAALNKLGQGFKPEADQMPAPLNQYAIFQDIEVAVRTAFYKYWSEKQGYDAEIKVDFKDPVITPVPANEATHSYYAQDVTLDPVDVLYEFTTAIRLLVYRDEETGHYIYSGVALTTDSEEWTSFKNISDQLSAELYTVAKQRSAGVNVKVKHSKPTEFATYKDPILKEHASEWWDWYVGAMSEANAITLGDQDKAYSDAVAGGFAGSKDEFFAQLATQAATTVNGAISGDNPSLWDNIWSGLKDVGGKGLDYITEWSPAQWVGAYAGYRTVRSVEKSNGVPKWLIYGGLGLGALMILK